jgi:hypothetical protein
MATRIQVRRGSTSDWNTADPILNEGEIGYNNTLGQIKVGDGESLWSELDYLVSAGSLTTSLDSYILDTEKSAIGGVAELDASKNILAPAGIIFEGTANDFETTLAVTDPTGDRTITLPDVTGTVITTGNLSDITNIGVFSSTITMEGSTANDFELTLSAGDPTADRTITFPDETGTVQLRVSDVSDTEIGYLNGVTSSIQTQLDARVEESLFDAKGDLLVGSADNTPAKLTVGTDGYILTANTSAANGIEWAAAPIGYSPPTLGSTQIASGATVTTISGLTLSSPIVSGLTVSDGSIVVEGATANEFETTLQFTDPTADRTITVPDATGTLALAENVAALSGATFTGAISGTSLTLSGDLTVNGTTTNINSTNLVIEDKNIVLGDTTTPTDSTADGGGITLLGATNKTFNWVDATDAWTSSEHMNLVTGKSYKINNTAISTALPALTWGEVKNGKSGLVIS